jgi:hypothetical protein
VGSYQPRLIVGLAIVAFASAAVSLLLRNDRRGAEMEMASVQTSAVD